MKNKFAKIGGSRPFADLALPQQQNKMAPAVVRPPAPDKPYGDPVHSKDRNGVYLRRGDRVKNHAEGGVTFVVDRVYTSFVAAIGDSTKTFGNNVSPAGWLDVFVPIDCCDCEIIGHHDDLIGELDRIAAYAQVAAKGGLR